MKTIYKYRDWQLPLHRRILTHQEVYLASPSTLNDPTDCRISPDYSLLTTKEAIDEYAKKSLAFIEKMPKPADFTFEKYHKKIVDSLTYYQEKTQKDHDKQHSEMQDKWYGIFSTSKKWNILLLWANYANRHTGFCVGFKLDKFRNDSRFGKAGSINYLSKLPRINPLTMFDENKLMENSFIETFTKSKTWRFENEFRLFRTSDAYTPENRKFK
ncbi:MAG: DUF2971 domain-containing protein [Bacteroidetes bacterium]|nr:DUF2971 domain-containing protein [Bacteroidota bacterium]